MARTKLKVDFNDLINKPDIFMHQILPTQQTGTSQTLSVNNNGMLVGSNNAFSTSIILGQSLAGKEKIYIVEPWQSSNPIKVNEHIWISLEKDLISMTTIKKEIYKTIEETFPEIFIKIGFDFSKLAIVKREVTLEVSS